jgi:DNA-binding SARP family transcriptional activator
MLQVGVLGPLVVERDGANVVPSSPKPRALFIDLLLHCGKTIGRDRIIDDLWGERPPATAAGVVQNYISQLRRYLGADVLSTSGQGYALVAELVTTDIAEFEAQLERARRARDGGDVEAVQRATTDALALWRGEPLADVAFESFAQAEIARLRELRALAFELRFEASIAAGRHLDAVAGLEAAVVADPLRERLWSLLMLALYRSGRQADALRAFQRARGLLADELGLEPSIELRDLERAILDQRDDLDQLLTGSQARPRARRRTRTQPTMLGRAEEWARIEGFLDRADEVDGGLLLLTGEPGIGKTRLLDEARLRAEASGGTALFGRGFEAERGRAYGVWVDVLRGAPMPALDRAQKAVLAALIPELSEEVVQLDDSSRLYDVVVHVLASIAERAPLVVLLDDLHWVDEQSLALLHFTVRQLADLDVSFLASARAAELDDNIACVRVIGALRRDGAVVGLGIGPLAPDTIAELTAPIAPGADTAGIAAVTNGNPLYALEMARALARGDEPLSRIDALIGDRLARLDESASALVLWVAAFGRGVPPSVLAQLADTDGAELVGPLSDLERHGVLRADADGGVDFVHDLVRTTAYARLSTPRRSMLHARIASVLASRGDPDDELAGEVARHAEAGGDAASCAAACVRAARRCLRLVAYGEAEQFVALGRNQAQRLPPAARVAAELELIHVLLHPGVRLKDPGDLAPDLSDLCSEAQRLGLDAELSRGLRLLAGAYHWGWGDIPRARALMDRAVRLIEDSPSPSLEPLLDAARCLAYLEMDMDRTARLFDGLGALNVLAAGSIHYQWGVGLVQAWRGDLQAARRALAHASEIALHHADYWASFECTARLALLELESGEVEPARPLCASLTELAHRLGEGSERAYAAALHALFKVASGDSRGNDDLDVATATLQRIDAAFLVPDLLGIAAEWHLRTGDIERAAERAASAMRIAAEVDRPAETARANALLACIAARQGDAAGARRRLALIGAAGESLPEHVEGLRQEAERLLSLEPGQGEDAWQ